MPQVLSAAIAASAAFGGETPEGDDPDALRLEMERVAVAAHEARMASPEAQAPGFFSRPGVVARQADGDGLWKIEIEAFTTGLGAGAIVEFPLVTLNSGHEYEALFQTAAKASDIRDAFSGVGLAPGLPASPAVFRFWPRGERVAAEVSGAGTEGAGSGDARKLAAFTVDENTGKPPPGGDLYAYVGGAGFDVDDVGPGSVVSTYNEPTTLLDVPRQAAQGDVYGSVVSAPGTPAKPFLPVKIVFSPEKRAPGLPRKRVLDVALRLSSDGFSVDGAGTLQPAAAAAALAAARRERKQDSYVSFSWDSAVRLREIAAAARLLSALENAEEETGVRIDAPPAGFPYYKAFLPQEEWRDRAKRFSQPCELRFAPEGKGATLVRIDEKWAGESLEPELSTEEIPLDGPAALPAALKANSPENLRVVLVFAPASATWGEIAPWLDAARPTHPLVQIFLD